MCDIKSSDGAYLIIKKGDLGAVKISLGEKYDFVNYNNIIDDSSNKKRYNLPDIFKEIIPREHWNGKKRVLIVIDQYGWAFDFGARGIKKYSKFNCTIKKHDKVTDKDIRTSDVIFFMCSAMWFAVKKKHAKALLENRNDVLYCVGLRASHVEGNEHIPPDNLIDVIGCISKENYAFTNNLEKNVFKTNRKTYLTHSAVNHKIFKPKRGKLFKRKLIVGWVGNKKRKVKRTHLLPSLDFIVKIKSDYGPKHFTLERSQQPMVEFYHSIDVLVNLSISEGMPQPVLEAMASGLPVIVTSTGAMSELIGRRWVIPSNLSDSDTIKKVNKRLQLLNNNPKLRKKVGKRNRRMILNKWSWKKVIKKYDEMFEGK